MGIGPGHGCHRGAHRWTGSRTIYHTHWSECDRRRLTLTSIPSGAFTTLQIHVPVPPGQGAVAIRGAGDRNLKMLREALGISVSAREGELRLDGPPQSVEAARRALERIAQARGEVTREEA